MTLLAASRLPSFSPHNKSDPAILGIGVAVPPSVSQAQSALLAADLNCQTSAQRAWLSRVFLRCGIEERGSVIAPHDHPPQEVIRQFYPSPTGPDDRGPTTATRLARYIAAAPALAKSASAGALQDAQLSPADITHLITVSCTGFFAPGLDSSLIRHLGLSPSVHRLHIGFMGCHAAFNAIAAARNTVLANPRSRVLVCCVELCSLHFSYGWDPGRMVANALFADGAAAIVLGESPSIADAVSVDDAPARSPWHVLDTSSFLMPDSLDAMTWHIGDHGFEMTLSPTVPDLISRYLADWCQSWLSRHGLKISDIAHWAIHPGGPKVLSAVADSLNFPPDALSSLPRHSFPPRQHVLSNHPFHSPTPFKADARRLLRRHWSGAGDDGRGNAAAKRCVT